MRNMAMSLLVSLCVAVGMARASTPTVTIIPHPEIPLQILEDSAVSSAAGLQQLTYTVANLGPQRLLALEILWRFHFTNGRTLSTQARADYIFSALGKLAAQASENRAMGGIEDKKVPTPVDSITGEVTFAQFADGTALGSDQSRMMAWLTSERRSEIQAGQQLLTVYHAQGADGLKAALGTNTLSDTVAEHGLKQVLRGLERKEGLSAVVNRIEQIASTQVPN